MRNKIIGTIAVGLVAGTASAEVNVTADIASAYVFRGYTFNDGAVFQPGIEASGLGIPEEYGAATIGAWGNMDLNEYLPTRPTSNFSEIDWYISYSLPTFVEGLDLFIGYTDYTYPNLPGSSEKEANAGVGYAIGDLNLGLTYYQGVAGAILGNIYIEAIAGYGLEFSESFSGSVDASAGYYDLDGGESGFNDYSIGGSLAYALGETWSIGGSLTYIGQGDDKVLPDTIFTGGAPSTIGYDVSLVGMLSLTASF